MKRRELLKYGLGATGLVVSGCGLDMTTAKRRRNPHDSEPTTVRPRVGWVPGDPYRPAPNEAVVEFRDIGSYDKLPPFKRTKIVLEANHLFPLAAYPWLTRTQGSIWSYDSYGLPCNDVPDPILRLHVLISDRGWGVLRTLSAEFEACDPTVTIEPTWYEPFDGWPITAER